jgi:hypothetical protein
MTGKVGDRELGLPSSRPLGATLTVNERESKKRKMRGELHMVSLLRMNYALFRDHSCGTIP